MSRAPRLVLAILAAWAIVAFLWVALSRLGHPYELEWQEGGMLAHVARLRAGEALYAPPSLEFIAFPYPPLYAALAALVASVVGEGLVALRLVSLLASLASCALLFELGRRRGGGLWGGLLAAGLFCATFRFAGAWFDVGRVDALSLALTLGALAWLEARASVRAALLGGLLCFLAFLAKQSALVPALCLVPLLGLRGWRVAAAFVVTLAGLVLASTLLFDALSDGWYRWYVFELLAGHAWTADALTGFWKELLLALGVGLGLAAWNHLARRGAAESAECAESAEFAASNGARERLTLRHAAVLGLLLAGWLGRAHVGGYDNTLLPACAGVALLAGPALARLTELERGPRLAAALLGVAQFGLLFYDPRSQLPTEADRAAGERLAARIRTIEGRVWMPCAGELARAAGKGSSAHAMAVIDLLQGADRATAQRFVDQLAQALAERRFAAIVLHQRWDQELEPLARHYAALKLDYAAEGEFEPVTGAPNRPQWLYVPR